MHLYLQFPRPRDVEILTCAHTERTQRVARCLVLAESDHTPDHGEESIIMGVSWMPDHICFGIGPNAERTDCRDWRFIISATKQGDSHHVLLSDHICDATLLTALRAKLHEHFASM
jgi:hypothetical protein